jgi:hypothetical protein
MTDQEIIDAYKANQREASELNLKIHEAKHSGENSKRASLARRLAEIQAILTTEKEEFTEAKQRIHAAKLPGTKKVETTVLTIHHSKTGYRRLATLGIPVWETVLMLAEEAPEWGVISYVFVPESEEIPEQWYDLPE